MNIHLNVASSCLSLYSELWAENQTKHHMEAGYRFCNICVTLFSINESENFLINRSKLFDESFVLKYKMWRSFGRGTSYAGFTILLISFEIPYQNNTKKTDKSCKVYRVDFALVRKKVVIRKLIHSIYNFCRYYISLAHVASLFPGMFLVQAAPSFSEVCTTAILRSVNGVLAALCSVIVYEITTHLRPTLSERKATIYAVVLALYPLHWFFSFLYYTDVASVTAVLAMHLACLKKRYWFSALVKDSAQGFVTKHVVCLNIKSCIKAHISFQWQINNLILFCCLKLGALAVVIRQTNIIWMLFVACAGVMDATLTRQKNNVEVNDIDTEIRKTGRITSNNNVTWALNLRKRKLSTALDTDEHSIPRTSLFSANQKSGLI